MNKTQEILAQEGKKLSLLIKKLRMQSAPFANTAEPSTIVYEGDLREIESILEGLRDLYVELDKD